MPRLDDQAAVRVDAAQESDRLARDQRLTLGMTRVDGTA
jgi:hypothetical protein